MISDNTSTNFEEDFEQLAKSLFFVCNDTAICRPKSKIQLNRHYANYKGTPKFFSKNIPDISTLLELRQQISFLGVGLDFIIVQFFN